MQTANTDRPVNTEPTPDFSNRRRTGANRLPCPHHPVPRRHYRVLPPAHPDAVHRPVPFPAQTIVFAAAGAPRIGPPTQCSASSSSWCCWSSAIWSTPTPSPSRNAGRNTNNASSAVWTSTRLTDADEEGRFDWEKQPHPGTPEILLRRFGQKGRDPDARIYRGRRAGRRSTCSSSRLLKLPERNWWWCLLDARLQLSGHEKTSTTVSRATCLSKRALTSASAARRACSATCSAWISAAVGDPHVPGQLHHLRRLHRRASAAHRAGLLAVVAHPGHSSSPPSSSVPASSGSPFPKSAFRRRAQHQP